VKYLYILFFILTGQLVQAQTCTGSLGDPITNITFGSGLNFGSPLASGITNLQYITDQCPSDGQYTITNSTNNCWSGTWLNINSDHTGNPNGYFMLINASFQPSDFYVQTVTGLCAATTYQFAAWVLNIAALTDQIRPNITFSIEKTDGTLLDSIHTGDIQPVSFPKWNQYGFYFTTPAGVSTVVLRMTNNAPGGTGNDLALDDITFRPAGPAITVTANGLSIDTVTFCAGNTAMQTFQAAVGPCYSSPTYQWQENDNNGIGWADIPGAAGLGYGAFPTTAGVYSYRLTAAQSGNIGISSCKVASSPVSIVILKIPAPAVTISSSSTDICAGSPATLTAQPTDGGYAPSYLWQVNGASMPETGPVYTSTSFSNADRIRCVMTSDAACAVSPFAFSNIVNMVVVPIPVASVQITASAITICSDSLVTFTATPFNGGGNPEYLWTVNNQPAGSDAPVYTSGNLKDGDVISTVMNGNLYCSIPELSNAVTMTVYPLPVIDLTPDTVIAAGRSIRLNPAITGQVVSWSWSPSTGLDNPDSPDPVASPIGSTTYQLLVSTNEGCSVSAKETVNVFYDLLMPNAFTPNGDGKNDLFRVPPSVPVNIIRFSVYNRWGELVFATTSSSVGWDGRLGNKPQPTGVYVWMIDYYNPLTKKAEKKKGTVELVR
jgi:gliding motility-associated-like protein